MSDQISICGIIFQSVGSNFNMSDQIPICGIRFQSVGSYFNMWDQISIYVIGFQYIGSYLNMSDPISICPIRFQSAVSGHISQSVSKTNLILIRDHNIKMQSPATQPSRVGYFLQPSKHKTFV